MKSTPYWHISELDYVYLTDREGFNLILRQLAAFLERGAEMELEDYEGVGHTLSTREELKVAINKATEFIKELSI